MKIMHFAMILRRNCCILYYMNLLTFINFVTTFLKGNHRPYNYSTGRVIEYFLEVS